MDLVGSFGYIYIGERVKMGGLWVIKDGGLLKRRRGLMIGLEDEWVNIKMLLKVLRKEL